MPDLPGTYATACLLCDGTSRDDFYLRDEDNGPCGGCGGTGEQVDAFVKVGPHEYEHRELGVQREVFG